MLSRMTGLLMNVYLLVTFANRQFQNITALWGIDWMILQQDIAEIANFVN